MAALEDYRFMTRDIDTLRILLTSAIMRLCNYPLETRILYGPGRYQVTVIIGAPARLGFRPDRCQNTQGSGVGSDGSASLSPYNFPRVQQTTNHHDSDWRNR